MIRPRGLRTVASLILAGATLTVCACSPAPETWDARTVDGLHVPEIHWPNGAPHPKDPWAQTLVEAKIIEAAAFNDLKDPVSTR